MANVKLGASHGWDYKLVESLSTTRVLTKGDAGKLFMLVQSSTAFNIALPNIADIDPGWKVKFIVKTVSSGDMVVGCTASDGNKMVGLIVSADGSAGESAESAVDDLTFLASKVAAGDWAEIEFDGDLFYVSGQCHDADHMTID